MGKGACLGVLVVIGCGKVSGNQTPDAAPTADASPDSAPARRCNPTAPFQAPVPLTTLNTDASDEGAWLTPDELTIYFDSTRSGTLGGYDIFTATRSSTSEAFTHAVPVMGVNDATNQRNALVTADGLTMIAVFDAAGNYEIGTTTRTSTSVPFGALSPVTGLSSTSRDDPNSILPDGAAVYFDSNSSGKYKIYRAPRRNGVFGTPLLVSGVNLNGNDNDSSGVVSADELTLFFTSDRAGGVGSSDIWVATRGSTADGFGEPVNVQVLNTAGLDSISWVSADGCVVYGTSGPCCTYDMFMATRGNN